MEEGRGGGRASAGLEAGENPLCVVLCILRFVVNLVQYFVRSADLVGGRISAPSKGVGAAKLRWGGADCLSAETDERVCLRGKTEDLTSSRVASRSRWASAGERHSRAPLSSSCLPPPPL